MKSLNIKAMIVDQSPLSAAELSKIVKGMFQQVYINSDISTFINEFTDVRPNLLFINLNPSQRGTNFDHLERLPPLIRKDVISIGYMDTKAPELAAHAIERGIQEVVTRPFNAEILVPQIKQIIQAQVAVTPETHIVRLKKPLQAKLKFKLRLFSVDENGLTFAHNHYLSTGTKFTLNAPLIEEIFGISSLEVMVTKTSAAEAPEEFYSYVEPVVTTGAIGTALRKFILRKHEQSHKK